MDKQVFEYLEEVARGMEDNSYNQTVHGKCTGCGKCCSNILPMTSQEIRDIKRYVKQNGVKECRHNIPLASCQVDMNCPFLDAGKPDKKCRIYPVRPMICRKFICDSTQRQQLTDAEARGNYRVVDMRKEFFGIDHAKR